MATATIYADGNGTVTGAAGTWTNPTNAYGDDTSYATCTSAGKNRFYGSYYTFSGLASTVPAGATLSTVRVEVGWMLASTNALITLSAQAKTAETGSNLGSAISESPAGGSTILDRSVVITASVTTTQLRASTFGVDARHTQGNSATYTASSLDYVRIYVDYSAAVTVTPTTGALTLTGNKYLGGVSKSARPGTGAVALTGYKLLGGVSWNRTPGAGVLVVTAGAPRVVKNTIVQAGTGSLLVASNAPTVEVSAGAVTITAELLEGSTVRASTSFEATASATDYDLTLTAGEVAAITDWSALRVRLTSVGPNGRVTQVWLQLPAATANVARTPGTAALELTAGAASVGATRSAVPGTASVVLTGNPPVVTAAAARIVRPGTATLVLTASAPTVGASRSARPGTASVVLTGSQANVEAAASREVQPTVAQLILTGGAPTVQRPRSVTPQTATLSLTSAAPTVERTANRIAQPVTATLVLSAGAPVVVCPKVVTPVVGTLTLTGGSPQLDRGVRPSTAGLGLTGYAPGIELPIAITPEMGALLLTGNAAVVSWTRELDALLGDITGGTWHTSTLAGGPQHTSTMAGGPQLVSALDGEPYP